MRTFAIAQQACTMEKSVQKVSWSFLLLSRTCSTHSAGPNRWPWLAKRCVSEHSVRKNNLCINASTRFSFTQISHTTLVVSFFVHISVYMTRAHKSTVVLVCSIIAKRSNWKVVQAREESQSFGAARFID